MLKNIKIIKILLLIFLIIFLLGVIKLFMLRFKTGDIYPVYSSLRTDPLGVKALYEGLDNLHGISASRNYQSLSKFRDSKSTTIFYFGIAADYLNHMHEDEVKTFESMAANGGRLIITLFPVNKRQPQYNMQEKAEAKEQGDDSKNTGEERDSLSDEDYYEKHSRLISLAERWGFGLTNDRMSNEATRDQKAAGLSGSILWHTTLYFKDIDNTWDKVYAMDGHPVIIERRFGNGTIVLSTDTYFVSNEAMWKERHPELLAWLVGTNKKVVFDETHFGINENPGIAALSRKYRLHGLFAGIILLAVLFVWKNSFSLVPPYDDFSNRERDHAVGKDYISGFVSLLRRNISRHDVLAVCFGEWKKTLQHSRKDLNEELKQIESVIESENMRPAKQRNPVEAYQSINKILSERRK